MTAKIYHTHLWGTREKKYAYLAENDIATTEWTELAPQSPFYLFVPQDTELLNEYEQGWKIPDIFPVNSVGIVTARDGLTIRWSAEVVWQVVRDFARLPAEKAREKYNLGRDVQDWTVSDAQADVKASGPDRGNVIPLLYRPFDRRFTYYTGYSRGFICRPRPEVMRHMLAGENLALITSRMTKGETFKHAQVTRNVVEVICMSPTTSNNGFVFPLYLYPDAEEDGNLFANGTDRHVNLSPDFLKDIGKQVRLSFVPDGTGDLKKTFGPEDVFHYIYAVFHPPTYRERYVEFLKIDFPRVLLTSDKELFRKLCELGSELVALHLLESPLLGPSNFITRYPVPGDNLVEKGHPKYLAPGEPEPGRGQPLVEGRVYISKDKPNENKQGQYFEGVPPEVWEFYVGGYQVCEKWLKVRRARPLSHDDLTHYQKVVLALQKTIRLMDQIDQATESRGGWPVK